MATSLSDNPETGKTDFVVTERYVTGLVNFIKDSATPLTIALQGEWGSGKTSLMNTLYEKLCPQDKDKKNKFTGEFIGITINTWEYSMLATPEVTVFNILGRLVKELSPEDSKAKRKWNKFRKNIGGFIYRFGRDLTKSAVNTATFNVGGAVIESVTRSEIENDENDDVSLSELREALEVAIKERLGLDSKDDKKVSKKDGNEQTPKGIIIFVDDLDRLNPPVAVQILELLKNVFTLKHCIFVLAIDYDVVVKGLEPKFGKLTAKNEREFRSFFDKIIQVPFSIPVNNYQPQDFVKESLQSIGYLNKNDDEKPYLDVIKKSVGNNPRSLKRLINTLSLLKCIKSVDDDNKLLNFIIVAIQICYPRVYSLLVDKPDFEKWDYKFAVREGIAINEDDISDWEDVLKVACSADVYLTRRYDDIQALFADIKNELPKGKSIGETLQGIMESTSVTGVKADTGNEAFDKKRFISKLHERVRQSINQKRPDIDEITPKNNTGNGGFNLFTDEEGRKYGVKFVPSYNQDKDEVKMAVEMSTRITRSMPEMKDLELEDMLMQTGMKNDLSKFNYVVMRLLKDGLITSKNGNYGSYEQELKDMHKQGHMSGDITHDAEYQISGSPKYFEDEKVANALADLIIANYDFRKATTALNI
ncbi:MAG: KAP family NTPase [Muribaculaceae bacterium]|nr:KAP family NTPase [Muribaculaceae bacterium]